RSAHALLSPTDTERNVPVGVACVNATPQQAKVWSVRTAHAREGRSRPALTWVNVPAGTANCAMVPAAPQHARAPPVRTAHADSRPALTCVNVPAGGWSTPTIAPRALVAIAASPPDTTAQHTTARHQAPPRITFLLMRQDNAAGGAWTPRCVVR